MDDREKQSQAAGINLQDVYFVLFKHKWMILIFSILGILAAGVLFFTKKPLYRSDAKLMVRYILETKSENPSTPDSQIKSPDTRGESIINSELEILSSLDLAEKVVDVIGAQKILAKAGGGSNRIAAAILIMKNLVVDSPRRGNIITISVLHPDPELVPIILSNYITCYLERHLEIHRSVGILDTYLYPKKQEYKNQLQTAEQALREAKATNGIISLADSQKAYIDQMNKVRSELLEVEGELGELELITSQFKDIASASNGTNKVTNAPDGEKINEYLRVSRRLEALRNKEAEDSLRWPDTSTVMLNHSNRIAEAVKKKIDLETKFPQLALTGVMSTNSGMAGLDLASQTNRINALKTKTNILNQQLSKIRTEAAVIDKAETEIRELQRTRDVFELNYRSFAASTEQARLAQTLGAGKISNISTIQTPTPPIKDPGKLLKTVGIVAAVGVFGGIGLALLIELILDQTVKRPEDLEDKMRLPLFLAIPYTGSKGRARKSLAAGKTAAAAADVPAVAGKAEIAPWDANHVLHTYHEALRDRLITYFEVRNMTHKPKLVAVTGCSKGSGVTTIAAGLAASLSETGDGNVLLVDMNLEQGAAHPFYMGKPACGISDVLEHEKRDSAMVQEHLFLATTSDTNSKLAQALPKRLANLVPRLKASDYDYIIFDMPTINQTSITPRLAGLMDMVLLVVEAEKSQRGSVKKANTMLAETNANVVTVLNKRKTYLPEWLHHEI